MAVKEWFRRLQPVQLYLILFLTIVFFLIEIVASHLSHALTLLLNAYHMLCNIIALAGCIASIKYGTEEGCMCNNSGNKSKGNSSDVSLRNSDMCISAEGAEGAEGAEDAESAESGTTLSSKTKLSRSDRRMKNTFGWARIDIVTMLVCCVFLASFCFSLLVEALQTLVHIDHLDEMHHPLYVLCIGAVGILLNALCYLLIGGYTFNQGAFLHVTKNGDIVLERNFNSQGPKGDNNQLSEQTRRSPLAMPKSRGMREMCRDVMGCVLVMLVSILVYFTNSDVAKYIDPIFAIISSISLFALNYPYMKESGLILLQTIPNHINIDSLKRQLLEAFPGIVNVHDLHVWQFTGEKIVSTAHIIFLDPAVYASITDQVTAFFVEMGITQVTIQPEFHKIKPNVGKTDCLIRCHGERCSSSQCCSKENFMDVLPMDTPPSRQPPAAIDTNLEKMDTLTGRSERSLERFASSHTTCSNIEACLEYDAPPRDASDYQSSDRTNAKNNVESKVNVERKLSNDGAQRATALGS